MMKSNGGPPSIMDFARQARHEEYNAALQASLPPSRAPSPSINFAGVEFERGALGRPQPRPQFQRRTLLDTFVERDDTYWVAAAKDRVLLTLGAKQTRVTLKIDVPFTDHSHIIGRQGRNTQKVMKETQCHIHFPDSNKNQDMEKSNQVSIAGPPPMVERARHMIRDLAPLTVTFELKNMKADVNIGELINHPRLEVATGTEDLHVLVRHNRSSGQPFALIRGSVHQRDLIKEAALNLMGLVFYTGTQVVCSTALEILQPQQETVKGPGNAHIQAISHRTGAAIHFPDVARTGATSFFIQGTLDAILLARDHIIGCLPTFVIFELGLEQPGPELDLPHLELQYQVNLSIKLKKSGEAKTAVIRCLECNLTSAYALRRLLLASGNGGPKNLEVVCKEPVVLCQDYEFMKDLLTHPPPDHSAYLHHLMRGGGPMMPPHMMMPPTHLPPFHHGGYYGQSGHASYEEELGIQTMSTQTAALTVNHGDCSLVPSRNASGPISPLRVPHPTPVNPNYPHTPRANLASQLAAAAESGLEDSPMTVSMVSAMKREPSDKAPGSGRRLRFADYDDAKMRATKQMQSYPNGTRYPTDAFAGFGFSKTLNDTKLRAAGLAQRTPNLDHTIAAITGGCEENGSNTDTEASDPRAPEWASPPRKSFAETAYFDAGIGRAYFSKEVETALSRTEDVTEILHLLKLGKYVEAFASEEVDLETFLSFDDAELKQLGVRTIGARSKLRTVQKCKILNLLKLGKYVEAFASEEVDLETFLSFDDAELKQLGVRTIGARSKLRTVQKCKILNLLKLGKYVEAFASEEVDLETFLSFDDAELKQLGVRTIGARSKLRTVQKCKILNLLKLGKYVEAFASEEVDLETFLSFDDAELKQLGVRTIGARSKLRTVQKCKILNLLKLGKYVEAFASEEVDLETFLSFDDAELKQLGVRTIGARSKLRTVQKCKILNLLKLGKYVEAFASEEVDLETFLSFDDAELKQLGVRTIGARSKLRTVQKCKILNLLKLGKYVEAFASEEVDLETFLSFDDAELKQLGVRTIGARSKLRTVQKYLKQLQPHH